MKKGKCPLDPGIRNGFYAVDYGIWWMGFGFYGGFCVAFSKVWNVIIVAL